MRTLLKITMDDVTAGNRAISEGRIQKLFENFAKDMKPETSFFYSENGNRMACFLIDLKEPSQMAQICEPFFFALNAKVQFFPVMNPQELAKGLESWSKKELSFMKGAEIEERRQVM